MFDTKGFDEKTVEKIGRICDVLQRVSLVEYTRERLSLYGGTSLNFLHFKNIPRLSVDIDFNFRDLKTGDWEKERDHVDTILKKILSDLQYPRQKIKIQASYPITRFEAHYITENDEKDSITIEIGYLRRIPIFKKDITVTFHHLKTDRPIELKTPTSEEIFGNKFCTLLYRYKDETTCSSRDLFDVYTISKTRFHTNLFETAVVLDSLMRPEPRLYKKDSDSIIEHVTVDTQLLNLVRNREIPDDLLPATQDFISTYIGIAQEKYKNIIDTFFDDHEFKPQLLTAYDRLNTDIRTHPSILWNLRQLQH